MKERLLIFFYRGVVILGTTRIDVKLYIPPTLDPEGVAEASQRLLGNAHALPK
jgi:hypothetical protein